MKLAALVAALALGGIAPSVSLGESRAALVARAAPASEISTQIRMALSRRLHVITGEGGWLVAARCVLVHGSNYRHFRCAVWAQSTVRQQDFWTTHVQVRCPAPLTLCRWRTTDRFPAP